MRNKHSKILKGYIEALEKKQAMEMDEVKHQLYEIYDSLNPVSILLNTVRELKETPYFKGDVLKALAVVLGGYLSRKLMVKEKEGFWSSLKGNLIQSLTSYLISRKIEV